MKIPISDDSDRIQLIRCQNDLLYVYYMDTYINIKGYLQKLIELLFNMGYYKDNKSLFEEKS